MGPLQRLCGSGLHVVPACSKSLHACCNRGWHTGRLTCRRACARRHAQPHWPVALLFDAAGCLRAWELAAPVPTAKDVAARPTYLPLANLSEAQVRADLGGLWSA